MPIHLKCPRTIHAWCMSPLMAFAWHATRVGLFRRSRTRLWHVDIACVARYSNQKKKREREGENVSARVTDCVCACVAARGLRVVQYSTVPTVPHIHTAPADHGRRRRSTRVLVPATLIPLYSRIFSKARHQPLRLIGYASTHGPIHRKGPCC